MAVFYRQEIDKSSEIGTSFVGKLFERAKELPASVPPAIRQELASLSAEVNGKTDALKQATKENADTLKSEVKELARSTSQQYIREGKTAELKNRTDKKHEKLLAHAKSFDDIRAGDILRMRASGENIANFLLTDEEGEEVNMEASTIEKYKNKKLLVNFGRNNSINASIGLGDILPYEVRKIEVTDKNGTKTVGILGSKDSQKGLRDRVGYYNEDGKYIAIYEGYSVKIIETGAIEEKERQQLDSIQMNHMERIRTNEMVAYMVEKLGFRKIETTEGLKVLNEGYNDVKDRGLFDKSISLLNARVEKGDYIRNTYKDGIGSQEKFIGKFGWYLRDVIGKDFPNVPPHMLVNLFRQESGFDPTVKSPPPNTAYGLGQINDSTWNWIKEHINNSYDRDSPYDQIHASAAYLDWIMKENNCDTLDAVIYYHMGPNVRKLIETNNQEKLNEYIAGNPAVVRYMTERTWQGYWNAARDYYLKQPEFITDLDLSKTGTELASQLGDYVISTTLPETGSSSCGKAVGILLNRFGIEELPQSGRDGKNWDDILEPRIKSGQFKKVAIKHPDEASAGAILVYDGSGQLGSDANKNYGHVEIKGSDGRYYSYYEGNRAGGSAANNIIDPGKYRELTGFTGYAYYPITKKL